MSRDDLDLVLAVLVWAVPLVGLVALVTYRARHTTPTDHRAVTVDDLAREWDQITPAQKSDLMASLPGLYWTCARLAARATVARQFERGRG